VIPISTKTKPQQIISATNQQPTKETTMRVPSRPHHITCPFCESGELVSLGSGFSRCNSCGLPLLGSALQTLQEIVGLPDALGAHLCECGHPEMRRLPDGILHCPACGSEVLPVEAQTVDATKKGRRWSAT
jgi:ribosomal protein L37AE/L43A